MFFPFGFFIFFFKIWLHIEHYFGEGNGTPLQYSCLKYPLDWGAWKAAVQNYAEILKNVRVKWIILEDWLCH